MSANEALFLQVLLPAVPAFVAYDIEISPRTDVLLDSMPDIERLLKQYRLLLKNNFFI
jgi:hypothetical protein